MCLRDDVVDARSFGSLDVLRLCRVHEQAFQTNADGRNCTAVHRHWRPAGQDIATCKPGCRNGSHKRDNAEDRDTVARVFRYVYIATT